MPQSMTTDGSADHHLSNEMKPTIQELLKAHEEFENIEPRSIFYRAATDLVSLALLHKTELNLAEALTVLLQTWNVTYYRFRPFKKEHISAIETKLENHPEILNDLRQRTISDFVDKDREDVKRIFGDFKDVLGKTGAAKCLHLLAPYFFPLWDTNIAIAYHLGKGDDAERYCRFMEKTKEQVKSISGEQTTSLNPLKLLDEYNYWKITLPILEKKRIERLALRKKMVENRHETTRY